MGKKESNFERGGRRDGEEPMPGKKKYKVGRSQDSHVRGGGFDLREVLNETMADLPPREQGILRRRFGLDGDEPQTLGQIAVDLGITAERVRQLQNAALGRIKKPSKLRRLQAFVE